MASGDVTRTFRIPTASGTIDIRLHEPALTEDNMGHKTWGSSLVLAKLLHQLEPPTPGTSEESEESVCTVLELGAGTGLAGLAAAAVWGRGVVLTDLPEIERNLSRNVKSNAEVLAKVGGRAVSGILDWTHSEALVVPGLTRNCDMKFSVILAADTIYSPSHPSTLVETIIAWLNPSDKARVIMTYPLRSAYDSQCRHLRELMSDAGLLVETDWLEPGGDDWHGDVTHSCSVWRWNQGKCD